MACHEFEDRGFRARVWRNELPAIASVEDPASFKASRLDCSAPGERSLAAIEFAVPTGGIVVYGLLGGEYRPSDESDLELLVPVEPVLPATSYPMSLAAKTDVVRVGGYPDYEAAIVAGFRSAGMEARRRGVLRLNHMAFGEVGSSRKAFELLASMLAPILWSEWPPPSPAALRSAVLESWGGR